MMIRWWRRGRGSVKPVHDANLRLFREIAMVRGSSDPSRVAARVMDEVGSSWMSEETAEAACRYIAREVAGEVFPAGMRAIIEEVRPVLEFVSRGRQYVFAEAVYPDARARRILGMINESMSDPPDSLRSDVQQEAPGGERGRTP